MKNKLRKIIIDNSKYLYTVTDKYHSETETNTLTLKVFLEGYKQSPLIIDFLTSDHYYMGQVLKSGISLENKKTDSTDIININEPGLVRKLILQGIKNGWTGIIKIDKQNGLSYLVELGYDAALDLMTSKS
ncbi:hypothetical protein [Pedobacter sp. FW305-3-2-15-E-R2A2]|uniref:hypothetical protein n=1 Tax=Pedobacter sp. FW305-3-2-15-E-R2A2 TaxID=3140251 RepID=UPI0031406D21